MNERDIVNDYCSKCSIYGRELKIEEVALITLCDECHSYLKRDIELVTVTQKYRIEPTKKRLNIF